MYPRTLRPWCRDKLARIEARAGDGHTLGAGALGVDERPGVDRLAQQVLADPAAADRADDQRALAVVAQPEVGGLAGQRAAERVHGLPGVLEHARHGRLGQPVDLQIAGQAAELARDSQVALDVAEPDRARDEQRARLPPGHSAAKDPAPGRRRAQEACDLQVDPHRVPDVDGVAAGLELDQLPVGLASASVLSWLCRRCGRRGHASARPGTGRGGALPRAARPAAAAG
jgi:hypothetical protein